jgi:PAS domain S-box-containing protein
MSSTQMLFNKEKINRLFPFYILIDENLIIDSYGASLEKLCKDCRNKPFSEKFKIQQKEIELLDFSSFKSACDQLITLLVNNQNKTVLKGQFEFLEDINSLLFIGSPLLNTLEMVEENNLTLNDFAHHDPLFDLLHALKSQQLVNDNLKKIAGNLRDLALFPMQNTEPIFRIGTEGNVVFRNPAADELPDFCYKDKTYKKDEFWKYISGKGDYINDQWTFEVISNNKLYSFVTRYLPENNYYNVYGRDITKQKKNEEELLRISLVASANESGVLFTDNKAKIFWVNDAFCKMTGYKVEEIIGKKTLDFCKGPLSDTIVLNKISGMVGKTESFDSELLHYRKDGTWFWGRVKGQAYRTGENNELQYFAIIEDITLEKEKEEQLKVLSQIAEDNINAVIITDKNGNITWVNKSFTEITEYSLEEAIHKKPGHLLWGPDTDKETIDYLKKQIDQGLPYNTEILNYSKSGKPYWLRIQGQPILNAYDELTGFFALGENITKIKHTETELEHRVKQFKALSANIPGVIYEYEFRTDGTEGFNYISPAVERVFGITPDDFRNYTNYIHPDDLDKIIEKNERSKNTLEPFYDESRLAIPGVGMRWLAIYSSFSYISQTGSKIFTGFISDITERKTIEETLKASEEKYHSIIANMNLGLLEVDINEKIIFANKSFCNMSGYSLDELLGQTARNVLVSNKKGADFLEGKTKSRKNGIADAYELEARDKNGNVKWWLVSAAPSYNDRGELLGSIGIHLDITEQKKLELQLIEARIQAEQSTRIKEIFLANMSHEIRTPMNAIMGMSNQLAKSTLTGQQQFYLEVIQSASENLLVIINDILDLSKIEAGKLSLENIGFEPKLLGIKAMRVLAYKAEERGLKLTSAFFDKNISPILIGDPYRLNQVLLNLMSNAIKFTEKGTVDLSFSLIEDNHSTQIIKVIVKDTGIGMDESFMEHLFEKFTQEYESTSRNYGGTGLGMSICKHLIDLMDGTMTVESKKGEGTTISFILNLKKGVYADLPEKVVVKIDSDFLSGKKILIADDNEMNRLVASIFLENYGAEIIHAINGQQAVEKFNLYKPDVILMDIQMPNMNGFEATRIIRNSKSNIPIIALTANAIKGESEKCIAGGMNDYVSKPFKEEELLKTIAKCLGKEVNLSKAEEVTEELGEELLYDLSTLKEIGRGNDEFIEKMVSMFCDQTPPMIIEMKGAYFAGDLEKMGAIAHKIKPSLDNLNIITLKHVIRSIESAGYHKEENEDLKELLEETDKVMSKVIENMKREYSIE